MCYFNYISICSISCWCPCAAFRPCDICCRIRLSHQITGMLSVLIFSSERSDSTHIISDAVLAALRYSASVLDLDMVACFLEIQEIIYSCLRIHNSLLLISYLLKHIYIVHVSIVHVSIVHVWIVLPVQTSQIFIFWTFFLFHNSCTQLCVYIVFYLCMLKYIKSSAFLFYYSVIIILA